MQPTITSEVVVAYAQCPRKAYLLLCSSEQGEPHEYVRILEQQRCENHARYLDRLQHTHADVHPYTVENLGNGSAVLLNACLQTDSLAAVCAVLTRVEGRATGGTHRYEPTLCVGTHSISNEQKLALTFAGYVLGRLQHLPPLAGRLIAMDGTSHTIKLDQSATALMPLLTPLRGWTTGTSPAPPPVLLNKHCPLCPFQRACHAQAEQEDNLSLLNGVTARTKRQYEKKGIFTVTQLSYLFKPRKRNKQRRKLPPVTHKLELQALAIRENKIYLHELPAVSRQPVELFLDIEGVPDRHSYYLIGVLVCQADTATPYALWADTAQEERHIWQQFVHLVRQYPDAPIYHYGGYEPRALATLAKRYHTDSEPLTTRLVNVNRYIYGKVYFPVRSNRLKDIGHFLGAAWTSPDASGLQSLVWRHQWEHTQEAHYRELLVTYNREDCQALKTLTDALTKIQHSADTLSEIDFVHQPKHHATELGKEVHSQFEAILKFAHFSYNKNKISFRQSTPNHPSQQEGKEKKKYASHVAHQKRENTRLKATKTVQVPRENVCPECGDVPLHPRKQIAERTIIDLVLTRNGVRKTLTRYVGFQSYCRQCRKLYSSPDIRKYERQQVYGDGFKAWIVYHRIALRLPYQSIRETVQEYFHEKLSISRFPDLIQSTGKFYASTEEALIQRLLESLFIHVDETPINIDGVNQYVWTFTDGQYVVFKLTETREATMVHEFLVDYHGVLISDFYPGYDSVRCRQQKCWVHLIRDLNDDLWGAPFDTEFETFILEVRNLIVPILEAIQKDGRQQRHRHTFQKQVDLFYEEIILNQHYHSELVLKYQNRFIQYRASLFAFLKYDGIPWENNTAERALRHLTVQEKISGSFSPSLMPDYLRLLAMRQTCRFQGTSFFQFLFSGKTDLDKFASHKRKRCKHGEPA